MEIKGKRSEKKSGQENEDTQRETKSGKKQLKEAIRNSEAQEQAEKKHMRNITTNHGRNERERREGVKPRKT